MNKIIRKLVHPRNPPKANESSKFDIETSDNNFNINIGTFSDYSDIDVKIFDDNNDDNIDIKIPDDTDSNNDDSSIKLINEKIDIIQTRIISIFIIALIVEIICGLGFLLIIKLNDNYADMFINIWTYINCVISLYISFTNIILRRLIANKQKIYNN